MESDQNKSRCPKCGYLNPSATRFCTRCGSQLTDPKSQSSLITCRQCGYAENSPQAAFCVQCGAPLSNVPSSVVVPRSPSWLFYLMVTVIVLSSVVVLATSWQEEMPTSASLDAEHRELPPVPQASEVTGALASFAHPATQLPLTTSHTISQILATPEDFLNMRFDLSGTLLAGAILYRVNDDWDRVSWLALDVGPTVVSVIYPGDISMFAVGDELRGSGRLVSDVPLFLADGVRPLAGAVSSARVMPQWVQLIRGLCSVIGGILALIAGYLAWPKRGHRALSGISLFLVMTVLVGCTMDIHTIIRSDGSGHIILKLVETTENVDFLRSMPNMDAYLTAWQRTFRDSSLGVDSTHIGDEEHFFVQRTFYALEDLNSDYSSGLVPQTWIYASADEWPDGTVYRLSAVVDTTNLYKSAPGVNSQAQTEIVKQLDSMVTTYALTLPGHITYHNADRRIGNRLEWDIRMRHPIPVQAESFDATPYYSASNLPPWFGLLPGLLLFFGGCLVFAWSLRYRTHVRAYEH